MGNEGGNKRALELRFDTGWISLMNGFVHSLLMILLGAYLLFNIDLKHTTTLDNRLSEAERIQ